MRALLARAPSRTRHTCARYRRRLAAGRHVRRAQPRRTTRRARAVCNDAARAHAATVLQAVARRPASSSSRRRAEGVRQDTRMEHVALAASTRPPHARDVRPRSDGRADAQPPQATHLSASTHVVGGAVAKGTDAPLDDRREQAHGARPAVFVQDYRPPDAQLHVGDGDDYEVDHVARPGGAHRRGSGAPGATREWRGLRRPPGRPHRPRWGDRRGRARRGGAARARRHRARRARRRGGGDGRHGRPGSARPHPAGGARRLGAAASRRIGRDAPCAQVADVRTGGDVGGERRAVRDGPARANVGVDATTHRTRAWSSRPTRACESHGARRRWRGRAWTARARGAARPGGARRWGRETDRTAAGAPHRPPVVLAPAADGAADRAPPLRGDGTRGAYQPPPVVVGPAPVVVPQMARTSTRGVA